MFCDEVKRIAYTFLDGTLADSQSSEIQTHLKACQHCDERFVIHRRFRHFLKGRLSARHAPDTLYSKLKTALAAFRTESPRGDVR